MDIATFNNVNVNFNKPGTYEFTVSVESNGITVQRLVTVIVHPDPDPVVVPNTSEFTFEFTQEFGS